MALITCSECSKQYSDRAPACPECGCPTTLQGVTPDPTPHQQREQRQMLSAQAGASSHTQRSSSTGISLAVAAAGALIALSAGLIQGSALDFQYNGGWHRTSKKTQGEQVVFYGIISIGVLTALGGLLSAAGESNDPSRPIKKTFNSFIQEVKLTNYPEASLEKSTIDGEYLTVRNQFNQTIGVVRVPSRYLENDAETEEDQA